MNETKIKYIPTLPEKFLKEVEKEGKKIFPKGFEKHGSANMIKSISDSLDSAIMRFVQIRFVASFDIKLSDRSYIKLGFELVKFIQEYKGDNELIGYWNDYIFGSNFSGKYNIVGNPLFTPGMRQKMILNELNEKYKAEGLDLEEIIRIYESPDYRYKDVKNSVDDEIILENCMIRAISYYLINSDEISENKEITQRFGNLIK